jgi:hypothetical protein
MTQMIDPDANWLLVSQNEMRGAVTGSYAMSVFKSQLCSDLLEYVDDRHLLETDWDVLSAEQRETLSDACYAVLCDNAPVVFKYELEQDFGPYPAYIRGVEGCYFFDILERDPIGPFSSLDLAKKAFEFGFDDLKSHDSE